MIRRAPLVVLGFIALLAGSSCFPGREEASSSGKEQDREPIRYEAEDGVPKDKAAETRRDYAVLEATLIDLVSPQNPEYKYHIQNVGAGREIVIDDGTCEVPPGIDLTRAIPNVDHEYARKIPADIQEDLRRRYGEPARSLADFKPASSNIIVQDLDKLFKAYDPASDDPPGAFCKMYPTAWGYVWAYPPGYSRDGKSSVVLFEGGPNGEHGLNWVYMLTRTGKRWEVQWRLCRPRE